MPDVQALNFLNQEIDQAVVGIYYPGLNVNGYMRQALPVQQLLADRQPLSALGQGLAQELHFDYRRFQAETGDPVRAQAMLGEEIFLANQELEAERLRSYGFPPPLVFDNLSPHDRQYQQYRQSRNRAEFNQLQMRGVRMPESLTPAEPLAPPVAPQRPGTRFESGYMPKCSD
jgi:hypothetical protein